MTENKRFVNKGKDIFQYGEWWCSAGGEHCADVIATAINELIEENEHIKHIIKEAYETERTHIGKSVLKQLLNNIGEI